MPPTGNVGNVAHPGAERVRRTQAERRAATRAALLDAVIDCVVEVGYARTTTRMVAERAGVTSGAQAHYFPTKADMVAEAIDRLFTQMSDEFVAQWPTVERPTKRQLESFLDTLWALHRGPLFQAALDLWAAARTDPELRESLRHAQRSISRRIAAVGAELVGGSASDRELVQALTTALTTLRGLAMLNTVSESEADSLWPSTRRQLAKLAEAARG